MTKFRNHLPVLLVIVSIISTAALAGCSDRTERSGSDPALQEADTALERAQSAMQGAGIDLQFSDIGTLGNLAAILPSPMKLGTLEDQAVIQDAIRAMYEVLDAVGQQQVARAPANPAQADPEISKSDLMLAHLHLVYLYVVDAVRIVTIEGWGTDGTPDTSDDLYFISFPDEAALKELEGLDEIYVFELTEQIQTIFDTIKADTNSRPEDYLQLFSEGQRQAILDALLLLLGAEVEVSAFPSLIGTDHKPIIEQINSVNRDICRQDALFHLQATLDIARDIAPDFEEAIDEFNEIIVEAFAEDFLDHILEWGFEMLNDQEVRRRLDELVTER